MAINVPVQTDLTRGGVDCCRLDSPSAARPALTVEAAAADRDLFFTCGFSVVAKRADFILHYLHHARNCSQQEAGVGVQAEQRNGRRRRGAVVVPQAASAERSADVPVAASPERRSNNGRGRGLALAWLPHGTSSNRGSKPRQATATKGPIRNAAGAHARAAARRVLYRGELPVPRQPQ